MSFLKKESDSPSASNLLSRVQTKVGATPEPAYKDSDCQVLLEAVATPIGTNKYERDGHKRQLNTITALKEEAPTLLSSSNAVIVKEEQGTRMYKQKTQFQSKVSIESLMEVLEKENLVLRASFSRPGFNSQNTSFMISHTNLKNSLTAESNEHGLKTVKLHVAGEEDNSKQFGYMNFIVQPDKSGEHVAYSLDYHLPAAADDKLFSEH